MGDIILALFQVSFDLGLAGVALVVGYRILDVMLKIFAEIFGLFADVLNKIFGWYMISVKFFAQDLKDKTNRIESGTVYFDELTDNVNIIIKAQRVHLESALPNCRVVALITQEED